jgi:uncharacterized membrane protein (UPF0127 family)
MDVPQTTDSMPGQNFLKNLQADEGLVAILNVTRNTQIASRAEIAGSGMKRSKGLLGRKGLQRGEGMWIVPCEAVHTFFMQFALDLIYLDKKNRIRKLRSNVSPWRVSACLSAHSIIELPVGAIRDSQSQTGDIVKFESAIQI